MALNSLLAEIAANPLSLAMNVPVYQTLRNDLLVHLSMTYLGRSDTAFRISAILTTVKSVFPQAEPYLESVNESYFNETYEVQDNAFDAGFEAAREAQEALQEALQAAMADMLRGEEDGDRLALMPIPKPGSKAYVALRNERVEAAFARYLDEIHAEGHEKGPEHDTVRRLENLMNAVAVAFPGSQNMMEALEGLIIEELNGIMDRAYDLGWQLALGKTPGGGGGWYPGSPGSGRGGPSGNGGPGGPSHHGGNSGQGDQATRAA